MIPVRIVYANDFYFTRGEIPVKPKRGRRPDPDKLLFQEIGLRPSDLEYLMKWPGQNPTQQLQHLLDFARLFAPEGEEIGKPRDDKGRWLPNNGQSKAARTRARKREGEIRA